MDAWVKEALQLLLIAIMATALGSGSLFVLCGYLWKFLMKWWHSHARQSALLTRTTADADSSGDQPLPEADALRDLEMGSMNDGQAADHPSRVAANNTIPHGDDAHHGDLLGSNQEMDHLQNVGESADLPRSSSSDNANAAEV